jgi:hypothetical protein
MPIAYDARRQLAEWDFPQRREVEPQVARARFTPARPDMRVIPQPLLGVVAKAHTTERVVDPDTSAEVRLNGREPG